MNSWLLVCLCLAGSTGLPIHFTWLSLPHIKTSLQMWRSYFVLRSNWNYLTGWWLSIDVFLLVGTRFFFSILFSSNILFSQGRGCLETLCLLNFVCSFDTFLLFFLGKFGINGGWGATVCRFFGGAPPSAMLNESNHFTFWFFDFLVLEGKGCIWC